MIFRRLFFVLAALCSVAHADQPWTFSNSTRYIALGDSLAVATAPCRRPTATLTCCTSKGCSTAE
jgi:hypothetical protein